MIKHAYTGKFIAIDGPNGVGKSATIERLKYILETQGKSVYTTKEPTETNLGQFVRNYAESNVGIELACLVAADRYSHLKNEILPQLQKGKIVITDRYFLSSLILQRMDNVDLDYIFNINAEILYPDLQRALTADEETIKKRLSTRTTLTRFEVNDQTRNEIKFLEQAIQIIKNYDIPLLCINNNDNLEKNVIEISKAIMLL